MSEEYGLFSGPLILEDIDKILWRVHKGFDYTCADGFVVTIPEGFECDLASIPRFFQGLLSKVHFSYNQPAVVHDYLYYLSREGGEICTRKRADEIFREGILAKEAEAGVEFSVADAMYHAVRIGGWGGWGSRSHDKPKADPYAWPVE